MLPVAPLTEPLPSLESLRCFAAAARLLNFRAAALAVGLTPAALGQRIKQLEEQLDARLFHRTTRSVTLTEKGMALVPHARWTLEAASGCLRAGRGEVGPPPIELTIGTRHELCMSWLVPLLPKLRDAQPELTLHLYVGSGPDLLDRVRALHIDCAVTSTVLSDPKLEGVRLHEERYAFFGSPKLLATRALARSADTRRHTLIDLMPGRPLFRYLRDADRAPELEFAATRYMGTIEVIRTLVLKGEGVAVLPEYFVAADVSAGRLIRLLPRVVAASDAFRLVFRADDPRRQVFEHMVTVMRDAPLR